MDIQRSVFRAILCAVIFLSLAFCATAASATFHGLGFMSGGFDSFAYGASADGSVVVGSGSYDGHPSIAPFRWTEQTGMVMLTPIDTNYASWAFGVSADGSVVVGSTEIGGFVWRSGTGIQQLDTNGGAYANARAVSADGSVIVGDGTLESPSSRIDAVYWSHTNGPYLLFDAGESGYNFAWSVSDDGSTIGGNTGRPRFYGTRPMA
jgi:uncharacterized membrane protein